MIFFLKYFLALHYKTNKQTNFTQIHISALLPGTQSMVLLIPYKKIVSGSCHSGWGSTGFRHIGCNFQTRIMTKLGEILILHFEKRSLLLFKTLQHLSLSLSFFNKNLNLINEFLWNVYMFDYWFIVSYFVLFQFVIAIVLYITLWNGSQFSHWLRWSF